MKGLTAFAVSAAALCCAAASLAPVCGRGAVCPAADSKEVSYEFTRQRLFPGFDGRLCKVQPTIAFDGKGTALLAFQKLLLSGMDVFYGQFMSKSVDGGRTWSEPVEMTALKDTQENGYRVARYGTVRYSEKNGRWFALGSAQLYLDDRRPFQKYVDGRPYCSPIYISVDAGQGVFTGCKPLPFPMQCEMAMPFGQTLECEDGDLLVPFYYRPVGAGKKGRVIIVRYAFDGDGLKIVKAGTPVVRDDLARGLGEPSLARLGGKVYLTLRSDEMGLWCESGDGLSFSEPRPWTWTDGKAIGNRNTQQHWVGREDGLFLTYTRETATNSHVFRNRAPIFMARFDPAAGGLVRETERVLVPELGARLGNFCVAHADREAWLVVAEWMQPKGCERFGSDNSIWLVKIALSARDPFEAQRSEMLNRQRSVIWNTDGNDMTLYPRTLPLSSEAFESVRLKYTEGTKIDSVFYCPHSSAFGWFTTRKTHDFMTAQFRPPDAGVYNAAADFAEKKGTDALEMASAYFRRRGLEIFVSIRMNDTHDHKGPVPPGAHFSLFKQMHPECLMGTMTNRPRYCAWTAVDFAHEAVRAHMRRFVREFLENYDIDGIEYDFFRHLQLFRTVADGADATDGELALMTAFMRELKDIAEAAGRRRGKPFLVAVRVPDSVGFCRAVGIDIERWMKERLVDIVIGSGYFQLNPWHVMAETVHRHGCRFYASLDEARNAEKRAPLGMLSGRAKSTAFFRAREAAAMEDGADGVYFFNREQQQLASVARIDPRRPAGKPQDYFAVPRATAFSQFWHYCAAPDRFLKMPAIDPQRPLKLAAGDTYAFDLVVGDDPNAYSPPPRVTVAVLADAKSAGSLSLSVNGAKSSLAEFKKGVFTFSIPPADVRKGSNRIGLSASGDAALRIADLRLSMR